MPLRSGSVRRAALVYNPTKVDERKLRARMIALSRDAGWARPGFHPTSVHDPGQEATRRALERKVDAVLVAGGDGTVRAVSEVMAGTGVPLAIVPSGTGNLLARNLRLPLDHPEEMIRAVFDGETRPIDIGWVHLAHPDGSAQEHAFVVLAGIGLDAHMIANTRADLKKSVGWVAYIEGAARALPSSEPFRVAYQVDDGRLHAARVHSMLFANCGALPGGISLIPEASIQDGTLDVALIQPSGLLGWFGVWRKVWWDNSVLRRFRTGRLVLETRKSDASVRYIRGRSVEAASPHPVPIELDGDEFGEASHIRCWIQEGALTIVVPRGHDLRSA